MIFGFLSTSLVCLILRCSLFRQTALNKQSGTKGRREEENSLPDPTQDTISEETTQK